MNEILLQNEQMGEWYYLLVDDCKAIITEAVFTSHWALVEGYWLLGQRLRQDSDKEPITDLLQRVAVSLNTSGRTLWYAVQAYDKYPRLGDIPDGKNISWHKLVNHYLPAPKAPNIKPPPPDKFRVIYADPPWKYWTPQHGLEEQATVLETHYESMKLEEICQLKFKNGRKVQDLPTDDAVLFLWSTSPLLCAALEVVNAWGFVYKASFIWDKVLHNVGYYNSVRHEILLVCTKGNCLPDKKPEGEPVLIDSVQSIERGEHSTKPERFYEIIESMYPTGNRIELFARKERPGWTSWGLEV